jgi:multimeric flavodoxin WrbA
LQKNPFILIFMGSPRKKGNTAAMVEQFTKGAEEAGMTVEVLSVADLHILPCTGCLRCNVLDRCVLKGDDWPMVAEKFKAASGVLFATPIYFFSLTGVLKLVVDRFRSLIHVRIIKNGDGIEHTPRFPTDKEYALIMVMGGLAEYGCSGLKDLFNFLASNLSHMREREVDTLTARGLPMEGQVRKSAQELEALYERLGVEGKTPQKDSLYNQSLLTQAYQMGRRMAEKILAPDVQDPDGAPQDGV